MTSVHPALQLARRGRKGDLDTFLGFWLGILADGRQARFESSRRRTRRTVDVFLSGRDVVAARELVGEDLLVAELLDAARVYFQTCRTDTSYSTTMWRTKRLTDEELVAKAAKEAVGGIGVLLESGLEGLGAKLPRLLAAGFVDEMGEGAEAALRRALEANPTTARNVDDLMD